MALIRCKQCGNPVSTKSKACPICGEPIATAEQSAATPIAPTATPSATEPTASQGTSQPKTLNDIIAERTAQPKTLNERLAEPATEEPTPKPTAEPVAEPTTEPTAEPVAEPTTEPTAEPTAEPAAEPAVEPTPIIPVMPSDEEDDYNASTADYEEELRRKEQSLKGFKMVIVVLILLLIPAAYFCINWGLKVRTIEKDYAIVESARRLFEEQNTLLQHEASDLVSELEQLKDKNDTMMVKYQEAVVMLEQLQKEKTYNYEQLARYKREVNTLKSVMKGYLRQIDSLNTINRDLQAKNVEYKREISTAQLRADVAEEKADELNTKVRIGAVIRASGVRMVALNARGNEAKRIKQATRLRTDFELTANELAEPGEKSIYICITGPDGYVLSSPEMVVFSFEGDEMMASAMRKVDYENESVPVSIYYDGTNFERGTYKVDIYIDGRLSGSQETYFE